MDVAHTMFDDASSFNGEFSKWDASGATNVFHDVIMGHDGVRVSVTCRVCVTFTFFSENMCAFFDIVHGFLIKCAHVKNKMYLKYNEICVTLD